MIALDDVIALARNEQFLAVVSTVRADGTVQASLVNAGVMAHPIDGRPCVAFVTYGRAKLANLCARPQVAVTYRSGWQWATVEGTAEVIGADDEHPQIDPAALAQILRDIFTAAGGTHDDWNAYDTTMREQKRVAVFVTPNRIYSN